MCGFCGFTGETENNKKIILDMTNKIIHRGPDGEGFFFDEDKITFGFRRLSFIDLNHGEQPMFNENKSISIIFNGEIYNYLSLREQLIKKGHNFYTESDTEVIIHAYEQYGFDLFKYLRGMFAFVIYDKNKDFTVSVKNMHSDYDHTIWEGLTVHGYPVQTYVRGSLVYDNGQYVGKPGEGKFVKCAPVKF